MHPNPNPNPTPTPMHASHASTTACSERRLQGCNRVKNLVVGWLLQTLKQGSSGVTCAGQKGHRARGQPEGGAVPLLWDRRRKLP